MERLKKNSIFTIKEEINLKESQIQSRENAFTPSLTKKYMFSAEDKNIKVANSEYEKNKINQSLQKQFLFSYDQESYNNINKVDCERNNVSSNKSFQSNENYNSDFISSSNSNSDDYLSEEIYNENNRINTDEFLKNNENSNKNNFLNNNGNSNQISINNININNTFLNFSLSQKDKLVQDISKDCHQQITQENLNINIYNFSNPPNFQSNNVNSCIHNQNLNAIYTHGGTRDRGKTLKNTFKGVLNYVIGKDKEDLKEELEQLKILYKEMEMQIRMIRDKTILFRNRFISRISYLFTYLTGKTLAFYCIYRIIMTIKNLLFLNYSDINVMLREEVLSIIDFFISIIFKILNLDVETIYYTVIEQYFSLTIVGLIIIINIRSFLNTILFIYTKTLKKYNTKTNRTLQMVFLAYFVGLFYVTSSIFLLFNLPITYR